MIVREAATLIVMAVMGTVLALQGLEKVKEMKNETQTEVCVEYLDDAGHRIKECEIHEVKRGKSR
ncbi:MAG: hypothetical protein DRQ44_00335 [Gammaproteobacteria bacterium]|nr:MAG: hypothetical protein DRQ44_00335 [Gammaproteobacteria bacterium]